MAHTRSYWSTTRLNGKPVDAGTFYLISEFDDMNPIATMGASVDEVLAKSEYARAATEVELRKLRAAGQNGNGTRTTPVTPPASRPRMDANEVMQATSDLGNPAKAGEAVTRLVEDQTGINLRSLALEAFGRRAQEWQDEHPEFYPHPGNVNLVTTDAFRSSGHDWAGVSKEMLTASFEKLHAQGVLFDAPAALVPPATTTPAAETFPGGSPVQRVEYPRGGKPGTGARSTSFRATQTIQPRTPKYSDDDIRNMPASKKKELILSNDPDYTAACDRMYANARASA
jgi:hypothetical protein